MTEPTLKPCPFCGGKARLESKKNDGCGLSPLLWFVVCEKGCAMTLVDLSDHDAVNTWNRRMP